MKKQIFSCLHAKVLSHFTLKLKIIIQFMVGPSGGHYLNHTIQKQLFNDEPIGNKRFEALIINQLLLNGVVWIMATRWSHH